MAYRGIVCYVLVAPLCPEAQPRDDRDFNPDDRAVDQNGNR